ncbi:hypothetical protein AB0878_21020 [Amycolatopsis sp. NPDC047767]|uniref:hypothetical protein n=1 Tax=Amycolatopsis sp. NPDC047767 TaxID=3156765 RepID=UPI00345217E1
MGFFDWVGDTAKAVGHGLEDAADWTGDRFSDAGNWFGDLYHGSLGEQTVPASDLVQKVMASKGAPDWHNGSSDASDLASEHSQISGRVQQLSSNLESVWTGGGADAAQARIRPLADVSQSASETFTSNSQNVSDLAHGFDEMKQSLQPMPPTPPHKNFFDEAAWWQTDTEKQIQDYNNVGQQNLQKYQGYATHAQTSGQGLKIDYGQLAAFDGGKVTIGSGLPATSKQAEIGGRSRTGSGPGNGGSSPAFTPGPGSTVPVTNGPGATTPVRFQPGSGPGDGTTTSGWTPPSTNPTGGPSWTPPSSLPPGGGSSGGNSWSPGGVSGFGPTSGFGGGGFGGESGGVSGGGRAGGSAGRLGAGPGAGAGAEESVGRGGAGAGARGAAGARGSSGMGGMGGAGKGGKGEEDKEHQRKYVLEDESAFDIVDDEDGRLRDPWTGLPPTPPTIGG